MILRCFVFEVVFDEVFSSLFQTGRLQPTTMSESIEMKLLK